MSLLPLAASHDSALPLYTETVGAGRPLLVMHGGLGWDHTYLRPALDALAGHAAVTFYDHAGNGRSARPADWAAVSHATWADSADALRARLGHERIVLFGHSYGGILALEYARRYPERLDGLVLCSTPPVADYGAEMMAAVAARGLPEAAAALQAAFAGGGPAPDDAAMAAAMAQIAPLYALDPDLAPRLLAGTRWSADAFTHAFAHCLPAFDARPWLPEIRVPTLLLAGRHDWNPPPAFGAERMHAAIPGSEMVLFEHSVHLPFAEEPEAFTAAVAGWLARLEPR